MSYAICASYQQYCWCDFSFRMWVSQGYGSSVLHWLRPCPCIIRHTYRLWLWWLLRLMSRVYGLFLHWSGLAAPLQQLPISLWQGQCTGSATSWKLCAQTHDHRWDCATKEIQETWRKRSPKHLGCLCRSWWCPPSSQPSIYHWSSPAHLAFLPSQSKSALQAEWGSRSQRHHCVTSRAKARERSQTICCRPGSGPGPCPWQPHQQLQQLRQLGRDVEPPWRSGLIRLM